MKLLILISVVLISSYSYGQFEEDKVLNFKTEFYYDSCLYQTSWDYYIEFKAEIIYRSEYPVTIDDSYFAQDDSTITVHKWSINKHDEPYSYKLINDTIFIKFVDYHLHKDTLLPYYALIKNDTIKNLLDKNYLSSKSSGKWFPRQGYSVYQGEKSIVLNSIKYDCYVFKNEEKSKSMDKIKNTTRITYLEKSSLLPVQFITTYFDSYTGNLLPEYQITFLDSTTSNIPDFSVPADLLIWKDIKKDWNAQQKADFMDDCHQNWGAGVNCDCLIKSFDGFINYYDLNLIKPNAKFLIMKAYDICE
ncbi:MAG: hypothetical protein COA38_20730 [Fluviicola sp.]|nr:MAG: hypothetical protein COA38_20730 [Fluviicola sp.]